VLAALYLAPAIYVTQDEVRHSHGGWINLRGFGTTIMTAPSQATLGALLEWLGVPRVDYNRPGVLGYAQLVAHVALSAVVVYVAGWGIEWLVRRLIA
jgi:hypothetical protein